jgi:NTE family protein
MTTTFTRRALVLSGGGVVGTAWMAGYIDRLSHLGLGLAQAELVVGTSAGARVGAQLLTGALGRAVSLYRQQPDALQYRAPVPLGDFVAASMRIIAEVADGLEAARRIANLEPLGSWLVPNAERRQAVAAQLPVQTWPATELAITAVDAASGQRAVFTAQSGVSLLDAAMASGALPGICPLFEIGGRRYADGGVHSLYNADLAAGHEVVIVLSPMPLNDYFKASLDAELRSLGSATTRVIVADQASLAAIGPDPNSPETAPAAVEAGAAQAEREIDTLRALWGEPTAL